MEAEKSKRSTLKDTRSEARQEADIAEASPSNYEDRSDASILNQNPLQVNESNKDVTLITIEDTVLRENVANNDEPNQQIEMELASEIEVGLGAGAAEIPIEENDPANESVEKNDSNVLVTHLRDKLEEYDKSQLFEDRRDLFRAWVLWGLNWYITVAAVVIVAIVSSDASDCSSLGRPNDTSLDNAVIALVFLSILSDCLLAIFRVYNIYNFIKNDSSISDSDKAQGFKATLFFAGLGTALACVGFFGDISGRAQAGLTAVAPVISSMGTDMIIQGVEMSENRYKQKIRDKFFMTLLSPPQEVQPIQDSPRQSH